MRAIEKPEDEIRARTHSRLAGAAALLYAKVRLKTLLESLVEPFKGASNATLRWVDTREWIFTSSNNIVSGSFFGKWHRLEESNTTINTQNQSSQSRGYDTRALGDVEKEKKEAQNCVKNAFVDGPAAEIGLHIIPANLMCFKMMTLWPQHAINHILSSKPTPSTSTSTSIALSNGVYNTRKALAIEESKEKDITISIGEERAELAFYPIGPKPLHTLSKSSHLKSSFYLSSSEICKMQWKCCWMVKTRSKSKNETTKFWRDFLLFLHTESKAIIVKQTKGNRFFVISPYTRTKAHMLEMDWKASVLQYIRSSASTSLAMSASDPLLQSQRDIECKQLEKEAEDAKHIEDARFDFGLPKASILDFAASVTGFSAGSVKSDDVFKYDESSALSSPTLQSKGKTPTKTSARPLELIFADDPPPVIFRGFGANSPPPPSPHASLGASSRSAFDTHRSLLFPPDFSNPGTNTSATAGGFGNHSREDFHFSPESPDQFREAASLYLGNIYSVFLHGISLFNVPVVMDRNLPSIIALLQAMPPLPEIQWKPHNIFYSSNGTSSALTLEYELFSSIATLETGCEHISFAKKEISSIVEKKLLVPESTLRAKYLGEEVSLDSILTLCEAEAEPTTLLTQERKLIEYRMQVALKLIAWHWTQSNFHSSSTKKGASKSNGKQQIEMKISLRNEFFALLETVAFLFATGGGIDLFREYFDQLETRIIEWKAPITAAWLRKKLGLPASPRAPKSSPLGNSGNAIGDMLQIKPRVVSPTMASSSSPFLPSNGLSMSSTNHNSVPPLANSGFMDNLMESTSSLRLEMPIPITASKSAGSALAMLLGTSFAPKELSPLPVRNSPLQEQQEKSADFLDSPKRQKRGAESALPDLHSGAPTKRASLVQL